MWCKTDTDDYQYFYDVPIQTRDQMVGLETYWAPLLTKLQFGKGIIGHDTLVVVNVKKEITKFEKIAIDITN